MIAVPIAMMWFISGRPLSTIEKKSSHRGSYDDEGFPIELTGEATMNPLTST
jgi:hypothetical protein